MRFRAQCDAAPLDRQAATVPNTTALSSGWVGVAEDDNDG
jgi:hypothetical protein